MTNLSNPLTAWVINKIKTEYPEDVALLVAVEGSAVNGDGHGEVFDYFVPATERGNELAQTFIIGEVGNDLYPRSWARCERTADLEDRATQCLGMAKILYARSPADEERFEALRQRLFDNLSNPAFTYRKALENLEVAMGMYQTMMFEERLYKVRGLAGFIFHYLSNAVAYLNGTYLHTWHDSIIHVVTTWKDLPEGFVEYHRGIVSAATAGELRSLAHLIIAATRLFIARHKPEETNPRKAPDYQWLADWYQELRTWWNRLTFYCDTQNAEAAFDEACGLQSELDIVAEEFALGEMDLLGRFDARNLSRLSHRAADIEQMIIAAIEEKGITLKQYPTIEHFLAAVK